MAPMQVTGNISDYIEFTIASRCPPTPLSVGLAGKTARSYYGVSCITGVVHFGPKGCSRGMACTICASSRGRTTANGCREGILGKEA